MSSQAAAAIPWSRDKLSDMIRQSCTSWTTTLAEDRSLSYLHYYTSTLVLFSHTTLNTTAEISGENWPQIVVYQKAFLHVWDPTWLKESGSSNFPGASKLFFFHPGHSLFRSYQGLFRRSALRLHIILVIVETTCHIFTTSLLFPHVVNTSLLGSLAGLGSSASQYSGDLAGNSEASHKEKHWLTDIPGFLLTTLASICCGKILVSHWDPNQLATRPTPPVFLLPQQEGPSIRSKTFFKDFG